MPWIFDAVPPWLFGDVFLSGGYFGRFLAGIGESGLGSIFGTMADLVKHAGGFLHEWLRGVIPALQIGETGSFWACLLFRHQFCRALLAGGFTFPGLEGFDGLLHLVQGGAVFKGRYVADVCAGGDSLDYTPHYLAATGLGQ